MTLAKKLIKLVRRFQSKKSELANDAASQMREVARLGQTLVVMELR
jgi:hypothetical protein